MVEAAIFLLVGASAIVFCHDKRRLEDNLYEAAGNTFEHRPSVCESDDSLTGGVRDSTPVS